MDAMTADKIRVDDIDTESVENAYDDGLGEDDQLETKVNEGVEVNDSDPQLQLLVLISQKQKLGEDKNFIVMGIANPRQRSPTGDLSQFVETGHDVLDVDISNGPNKDGMYTVFVEVERDSKAFDKINAILNDIFINRRASRRFNVYKLRNNQTPPHPENFNSSVNS